VTDDYMGAAQRPQHGRGNLAGVCTLFFPIHVLSAYMYVASMHGCNHGGQADKGRAQDDLIPPMIVHQRKKGGDKVFRLWWRLVHLPVGGDEFFSHRRGDSALICKSEKCSFISWLARA